MTKPLTPTEVFLALVHGVSEGRWADLPNLYAEETYVVHPLDPRGSPPLRSREEIRAHFAQAAATAPTIRRRPANITIHETTDPEVVIAEFDYEGVIIETNEPFTIPCIFVLRVREGEIVSSRDYVDHIRSARARGMLDHLVTTITSHPAST